MVLGESYKESNGSQEAAVNRTVLLQCRHQLGQLRENDDTIVHALNQVLLLLNQMEADADNSACLLE